MTKKKEKEKNVGMVECICSGQWLELREKYQKMSLCALRCEKFHLENKRARLELDVTGKTMNTLLPFLAAFLSLCTTMVSLFASSAKTAGATLSLIIFFVLAVIIFIGFGALFYIYMRHVLRNLEEEHQEASRCLMCIEEAIEKKRANGDKVTMDSRSCGKSGYCQYGDHVAK